MDWTRMAEAKDNKAEAENEMYCRTGNASPAGQPPITAEIIRAHTDFVLARINQAKIDIKARINELRKETYDLEKELERLNKIPEKL